MRPARGCPARKAVGVSAGDGAGGAQGGGLVENTVLQSVFRNRSRRTPVNSPAETGPVQYPF
uniref:Uncharacterized protein n=1 Tax=Desulfovibrio desulfuricans (strain ATCC 27774 / DSM 6949 / MB) TaxID=525146 RepID=B8J3M3_DESDA